MKSTAFPVAQACRSPSENSTVTKSDFLIHKSRAATVNGLVGFLGAERKRVLGDILRDAERLECLLFSGYEPYFVGDEPPGM
jgi:hypothetical protein